MSSIWQSFDRCMGMITKLLDLLSDRVMSSILTLPELSDILNATLLLSIYTAIALPLGFTTDFLQLKPITSWQIVIKVTATSFIAPAILEELVFRVCLLPRASENSTFMTIFIWAIISLVLFIIYHPLNALIFFPTGQPTFFEPIFLFLATLLGITCSLAYLQSYSLWTPVVIHWLVVVVWLLCLGGIEQLNH